MFAQKTIAKFKQTQTPFYYYDIDLLKYTIENLILAINGYNFQVHYSLKANASDKILNIISAMGLGADCVSGNEVLKAISCGFDPEKIVFAGVGKTDHEIAVGIDTGIFCFNCESLQEIEIINNMAKNKKKLVRVALRLNPDINANTHPYIATGIKESKFGMSAQDVEYFAEHYLKYEYINLCGIHIHVGSMITNADVYKDLCIFANKTNVWFQKKGIVPDFINLGGGLCINYRDKNERLANFQQYFDIFKKHLKLLPAQKVIFELGCSIVAHCGTLITQALYTKSNQEKKFVITDAGMNDLLRPALYKTSHHIENITPSEKKTVLYDIAGPICESADFFAHEYACTPIKRGDLLAIYSVGAYGQTMASKYNMRDIAQAYYSDEF